MLIHIPALFAEDRHDCRKLSLGKIVKINSRFWTVEIAKEDARLIADITSDAEYYSDIDGFDFDGIASLSRSARSALRNIKKAFAP